MNRALSILFLLLALIISVQPVSAFHFCGGELASVEFFKSNEAASCCCSDDSPAQRRGTEFSHSGCCHTVVIESSTDDYGSVSVDKLSQLPQPTFMLFAKPGVAYSFGDSYISDIKFNAPPELLPTTGRELLTRICTLII